MTGPIYTVLRLEHRFSAFNGILYGVHAYFVVVKMVLSPI
jgi:hypothetical protein